MNTIRPHPLARLAALAASVATTFALLSSVVSLADPRVPYRNAGFATRGTAGWQPAAATPPASAKEVTALSAGA